MRFKIIDKCCNESKTFELSPKARGAFEKFVFEIAPVKKGHSIIIHEYITNEDEEMTIEYVPNQRL